MDPIARYFNLIRRIDAETQRLTGLHGSAITCHPGCTGCCVNLTVFPVEFHAIRQAMAGTGTILDASAFDPSAACGFLKNGRCRIYSFRPIICRTHGLPIVFLDDTGGEYAWEVSFCELNFTGRDSIEFTETTLLNIEDINMELSRINRDFVVSKGIGNEPDTARIELKNLCFS